MRLQTSLAAAAATLSALAGADRSSESCKQYEYVVVGSGAGGGTLAASLARKGHSVFLIEAGGDHGDNLLQQIPLLGASAAEHEAMSWEFFVRHSSNETQNRRDSKFTYRLPDGSLYFGLEPPEGAEPLGTFYPRGATLGGSTQVNAQGFMLPSSLDWEYIADFTGDSSWGSERMREYFMELENCLYLPEGSDAHGFNGPISTNRNNISYVVDRSDVSDVLARLEYETTGIEVEDHEHLADLMRRDVNHPDYEYTPGVYQDVACVTENKRRSGARDYIVDTIEEGYPLTLSPHSLATRILFDERGKVPKAVGVEYLYGEGLYGADRRYDPEQTGELRKVRARKEVIIAGGSFNTPQILKLSGIGPREELEKWDIPVVVDLPGVGANLQDHTEGILSTNASVPWADSPFASCTMTLNESDPCLVSWLENGDSPYGEAAAPHAIHIQTSLSQTGQADLWTVGLAGAMARGFYPGYSHRLMAPSTWSWIMVKVHAPGRFTNGSVTLQSADPRDVPFIMFDWLPGEEGVRDIEALAEGLEVLTNGFEGAPEQYHPMVRHQPAVDDDVRQNLRDEAFGHHASSTCRMGPKGDANACVDSQLRVNGVRGLRVVDASVFPFTPSSFPVLSVHLVGLKAADMISNDA